MFILFIWSLFTYSHMRTAHTDSHHDKQKEKTLSPFPTPRSRWVFGLLFSSNYYYSLALSVNILFVYQNFEIIDFVKLAANHTIEHARSVTFFPYWRERIFKESTLFQIVQPIHCLLSEQPSSICHCMLFDTKWIATSSKCTCSSMLCWCKHWHTIDRFIAIDICKCLIWTVCFVLFLSCAFSCVKITDI